MILYSIFSSQISSRRSRELCTVVGVLGVHAEVILCGAASQDLVFNSGLWWLCLKAAAAFPV